MKSEGPQVSGLEGWTWELSRNGIYENNRGGLERERGEHEEEEEQESRSGCYGL